MRTVEERSQERTSPRSIARLLTLHVGLVGSVEIHTIPSYSCSAPAKSLVAAGLARCAPLQLSYAIGFAEPLSILVDTYDAGKKSDLELVKIIRKKWDLQPGVIVTSSNCKSQSTARPWRTATLATLITHGRTDFVRRFIRIEQVETWRASRGFGILPFYYWFKTLHCIYSHDHHTLHHLRYLTCHATPSAR